MVNNARFVEKGIGNKSEVVYVELAPIKWPAGVPSDEPSTRCKKNCGNNDENCKLSAIFLTSIVLQWLL